jgi:transposase
MRTSKLKYGKPVDQIPEYRAWKKAKERCTYKKDINYKNYGERDITMCDEWFNSYDAFISYMGEKPSPNYTLDRINVNKGYRPGNCKWSTAEEQANNKRNNVTIDTPEGKMSFKQASERFGLHINTIKSRIAYGFPKNELFLQDDLRKMPVKKFNTDIGTKVIDTVTGKTYTTIKKAALDLGISRKRLAHMLSGNTKNDTSIVKL